MMSLLHVIHLQTTIFHRKLQPALKFVTVIQISCHYSLINRQQIFNFRRKKIKTKLKSYQLYSEPPSKDMKIMTRFLECIQVTETFSSDAVCSKESNKFPEICNLLEMPAEEFSSVPIRGEKSLSNLY